MNHGDFPSSASRNHRLPPAAGSPMRRLSWVLASSLVGLALAGLLLFALQAAAATPVAAAAPAMQPEAPLLQENLPPTTPPQDPEAPQAILGDLQVDVSVNKERVRPGELITYTIRYTNSLGVEVPNVLIKSTLSDGQLYSGGYQSSPEIPTDQFSYSYNPTQKIYTLQWQLPSLAAGAAGQVTYNVQVFYDPEPKATSPMILLGNAVEISTSQPGVSGGSDQVVPVVVGPLLTISKAVSATSILPGRTLYYTITVQNVNRADAIPATDLVVKENLPARTIFLSASSPSTYDDVQRRITWNLPGPLDPGGSLVLTFSVQVDPATDSGVVIQNAKTRYSVRSAEVLLAEITGSVAPSTTVEPTLRKTATTKRRSGSTALAYPTELVTYTVTVINPLGIPLSGVVVSDTLPGNPEPFTYLYPTPGSPTPVVLDGGRTLQWIIDLPAWGSTSFGFVVQVPRQTFIPNNNNSRNYTNALAASHPEAHFCPESGLAVVKVEAPVTMNKIVSPTHGKVGETVVYTITLTNRGPFLVSNIALTDTLEGNFQYLYMTYGPLPLPDTLPNPIVWTGLQVAPNGGTTQLAFAARIDGNWLTTYYNNLSAYSPDVYIPRRTGLAGVKVDPNIGVTKSVVPTQAFVFQPVQYTIGVTNLSTETWTLDQVQDYLPTGFTQVGGGGSNTVTLPVSPPYGIPPGQTYQVTFQAAATSVTCSTLPKAFPNLAGNVQAHFIAPAEVTVVNAANLAPVTIVPNIKVDLVPERRALQRGDVFTYTLYLENVSPVAANNSTLVLTLPAGISYLGTLSGPPPATSGSTLTWTGINLAPGATLQVVMSLQVLPTASLGKKTPTFSATSAGVCFGKLDSGDLELGDGSVTVMTEVLDLNKTALQTKVAPLALVDFEISIKNNDAYRFTVPVITDTLPSGFTYFSTLVGSPPEVQGNKLIWHNLSVNGGATLRLRIRLQASPLYGDYLNEAAAFSPETVILPAQSAAVQVRPLFALLKVNGEPYPPTGTLVPYTITLVNLSQTIYTNVRVTDTLPAGLFFSRMQTGYPAPLLLSPDRRQIVWNIAQINANCGSAGCQVKLAFFALVDPWLEPGVYWNTILGFSPSGSVPGPIGAAPITVTAGTLNFLPYLKK